MNLFDRKMEVWKSRLLDLSRRNRLLYFRPSRFGTVRIISPALQDLFQALVVRDRRLRFPMAVRPTALESTLLDDLDSLVDEEQLRIRSGDLNVEGEVKDLDRRLYRLRRDYRVFLVEQGVHTCFLALGLLRWRESDSSEEYVRAPLILLPTVLTRESDDKPYTLELADEDPVVNPTLAFRLQRDFAVQLPDLPDDLDDFSVMSYLDKVASGVGGLGWSIDEEAWLGRFSFQKLSIYQDLENHRQEAQQHLVVAALAGVSHLPSPSEPWSDENFDEASVLQETYPVLDADSSQTEVLLRARAGENLKVDGPPGTGKSQTISNLIAQSLRDGKRVLFVSAKMAALEMVQKRLHAVGLAPAILEVHSHKANKRAVTEELGRTLFRDRAEPHSQVAEQFESVRRMVTQLNDYVRELHWPRDGRRRSAYQVIGRLASLNDIPELDLALPFQSALDVSFDNEENIRAALRELTAVPEVLGTYDEHPFRGWDAEGLTIEQRNQIRLLLQAILTRVELLDKNARPFATSIGSAVPVSIADVKWLCALGEHLSVTPPLIADWFKESGPSLDTLSAVAEEGRSKQSAHQATQQALLELCGLGIAQLPAEELNERFLADYGSVFRWLKGSYRRDMQSLRDVWVGPKAPDYNLALQGLELGSAYNTLIQWLEASSDELNRLFGEHLFTGFDTDWDAVFSAIIWADQLRARFSSGFPRGLLNRMGDIEALRDEANRTYLVLKGDLEGLAKELDGLARFHPQMAVNGSPLEEATFGSLLAWLQERAECVAQLFEWSRFQRANRRCETLGLGPFVSQILKHRIPVGKITDTFYEHYFLAWLAEAERQTPVLARFNGSLREQVIESYRELDRKLLRLSAELTLAKVEETQPMPISSRGSVTSQMGTLLREVQKRRRHKPLRRLFTEIPQLLQALKPCLLMSPLSVSSYLEKGFYHFDLVVFDEASQIPESEAICAILRADQVVVAGDAKQLPPTTFFQVQLDDDYDEDEMDLAPLGSILDACAALPSFGHSRLRWHYRSRHEGLIAFSNREFYEGELITFPSPATIDRSVQYYYVEGATYDRGGSKTNRKEARRVAELIMQHFETHGHRRSLGVVALSRAQEGAIDDALLRLKLVAPHLAPFFDEEGEEPFFVKNLERVQGDERDHIIISIGYGPDAAGNMSLNFGPINQAGGERRLNVAVTRARWQTTVVCSFLPHQLDLARLTTQNQGIVKLQGYLEYAYRGEFAPETTTGGDTESPFEDAVKRALGDAGLQLDTQVGCSGFRIDLAVRHPDQEGRYILGIECDGAQYHSSRTARDRDRLRQEVLEGLGWDILRIWSLDWLRDPQKQVHRVLESVDNLRLRRDSAMLPPSPQAVSPVDQTTEDLHDNPGNDEGDRSIREEKPAVIELPPYVPYPLQPSRSRPELEQASVWPAACRRAAEVLQKMVDFEGPIHRHLAARRLARCYGIKRLTRKVERNIEEVIRWADATGAIRRDGDFLWPKEDRDVQPRRRLGADRPPIEEVAIEEIAATMRLVLQRHIGMSEGDLATEVARLLGYNRTGSRIARRMTQAVDHLLNTGKIARTESQLVLATLS